MSTLNNKVALVTGGSRSIGAAIVKKLVAQGASVAFTYISSAEKANALAKELNDAGGKVIAIKADSGNTQEIQSAVETAAKHFGQLDILVNNAGVFVTGNVDDASIDTAGIDRQFAINVSGVATAVRTATKFLGEGGRVITIGSVLGEKTPYPGMSDYSASKAAVAAYTRGWARDLGTKGITVNTVQPGPIDTDMNPTTSDFAPVFISTIPLGRYGKVEEIAATVAFLAGPDASYITGTTINVDGGIGA